MPCFTLFNASYSNPNFLICGGLYTSGGTHATPDTSCSDLDFVTLHGYTINIAGCDNTYTQQTCVMPGVDISLDSCAVDAQTYTLQISAASDTTGINVTFTDVEYTVNSVTTSSSFPLTLTGLDGNHDVVVSATMVNSCGVQRDFTFTVSMAGVTPGALDCADLVVTPAALSPFTELPFSTDANGCAIITPTLFGVDPIPDGPYQITVTLNYIDSNGSLQTYSQMQAVLVNNSTTCLVANKMWDWIQESNTEKARDLQAAMFAYLNHPDCAPTEGCDIWTYLNSLLDESVECSSC